MVFNFRAQTQKWIGAYWHLQVPSEVLKYPFSQHKLLEIRVLHKSCFACRFHGCLLITEVSQSFPSSCHASWQKTESEFAEEKYICLNISFWCICYLVSGNIPTLPFPSAAQLVSSHLSFVLTSPQLVIPGFSLSLTLLFFSVLYIHFPTHLCAQETLSLPFQKSSPNVSIDGRFLAF